MNCGGAHLILGLQPDIAVFAKGISNGYPMGIIIGKKKFMDAAQDSFISSTYWTERIGPVAAIATIMKMRKYNVQNHMMECGRKVQEGWSQLAEKHALNIHVGSIYPLSHFDFKEKPLVLKTLFTQEMLALGFLATNAYYSCFAHKQEHINKYLIAVDKVFEKISKAVKEGNPEKYLKGPVCFSGFKRLN
jgi:glutamate-1-semialdehyde aminotransferase